MKEMKTEYLQAAIEYANSRYHPTEEPTENSIAEQSFLDGLNEASQFKNEWGSVETPPDNDDYVIICNNEDGWTSKGYYAYGKWYDYVDHDCEVFPTHWQPLPIRPPFPTHI